MHHITSISSSTFSCPPFETLHIYISFDFFSVFLLSIKSVPSFLLFFLLSTELCWQYLVWGRGGPQWQCWHLFESLALCQTLSIAPATRVTLLDLSPTNLSADALCGRKTSGYSLFGTRAARVPTGDLKMEGGWGGRRGSCGCYNVKKVRKLLKKKNPSTNTGRGTQRIQHEEEKG